MKTTIVFTVLGGLIAALWYVIFNLEDPVQAAQPISIDPVAAPQSSDIAEDAFARLSQQLQAYQHSQQEQLREATREQARLSQMLQQLEVRLDQVEDLASANALGPVDEAPKYDPARPPQLSDGQVGAWMDNSLDAGLQDEETTVTMADQVINTLHKVPGVQLDDVSCGDRFCRATFSHVNGQQPELDELFGEPPFVNEGFTVIQPDGRVRLYFNQPGQSLAELRGEAEVSLGY